MNARGSEFGDWADPAQSLPDSGCRLFLTHSYDPMPGVVRDESYKMKITESAH